MSAQDTVARLRASGPHLSVGILSADMLALSRSLELLEGAGVDMVHTDVMDGVFCPQLTVGPAFLRAQRTTALKDAHLMIDEPTEKVDWFVAAGADIITFHPEATRHPHRVLQALGTAENRNDPERGIVRGVALDPGTPVEAIAPLLWECEYVLVLAVNPGWGGQSFAPSTPARIAHVKELVAATRRDILVGVDGGVTRTNVAQIASLGVDVVVSGSAVFDGKAPEANAQSILEELRRHRRA